MSHHSPLWKRLTIVIGLVLTSLLVVLSLAGLPRVEAHLTGQTASVPGTSFLYRFDTTAQTFFTIPLSNGAMPIGVAVTGTNPTHVWIAEYGLNRISHVTFTSTADYTQTAYPITSTANSGPYRIAVNGNDIWFTERGANRVGRLDAATGHLDEFYGHGLSPNAGLSDIKVASDGTTWMGGQTVQRLIKLTVSSPGIYAFTEYTDTVRPSFLVAPAFLAVGNSDSVWMTMPAAASHRMALYEPGAQSFTWPALPIGAVPYGIALTPGLAWYTDPNLDTLSQISLGTSTIVNQYGAITDALEMTAESANTLWLTQQPGHAAIGRFIYTNPVSTSFDSFSLPIPKLRLTGIAAAPGSGVWSAAYMPEYMYLPLILK